MQTQLQTADGTPLAPSQKMNNLPYTWSKDPFLETPADLELYLVIEQFRHSLSNIKSVENLNTLGSFDHFLPKADGSPL